MDHEMAQDIQWCKRCGLARIEIVQSADLECRGNPSVTHARYLSALREFRATFGPIIAEVERLSLTVTGDR